jgi:hypothetical protein
MSKLVVIWSNGDKTKIELGEEAVRDFKEKKPHQGPWNGWTMYSERAGWNLAHAREVWLEE